ncbi:MAG: galactitol system component [Chloroflexota bacterium]|nr:galactitol system component [Chloroflexota bacterium]
MSRVIAELLQPTCVLLQQNYDNSEDIIRAISAELFKAGYVRESFAQAAIDREKNLPTGLPLAGGINAAIPHTEIEHVIKPALGLVTLNKEVNFQNMVDPTQTVPVRLVFILALEQPKAQIEMLQEIACVLQNPDLVERILKADNFDKVVSELRK